MIDRIVAVVMQTRSGRLKKKCSIVVHAICDECHIRFEGKSFLLCKQFHFHSKQCANNARKLGGLLQKQIEKTTLERYGVKNVYQADFAKEKSKKTSLKKYGTEFPQQSISVKQKIAKTNFEKYGNICSAQSVSTKHLIVERYGQKGALGNAICREKGKKTLLERYGVDNIMKSPEKVIQAQQTSIERYGEKSAAMTTAVKEKTKKKFIEKYGFVSPLQNESVKEKRKLNNIQKYGVSAPIQNEEIKQKIFKTNIKKYGSHCVLLNSDIKAKVSKTLQHEYGVKNAFNIPFVKAKANSPEACEKRLATMVSEKKRPLNHFIIGQYFSTKMKTEFYFNSSWEKEKMQLYDADKNIIEWSRCKISIPYENEEKKQACYIPDFVFRCLDGSVVVEEIKGIVNVDVYKKAVAATDLLAKLGIIYNVLTKKNNCWRKLTINELRETTHV
jgi:hypothetical protein